MKIGFLPPEVLAPRPNALEVLDITQIGNRTIGSHLILSIDRMLTFLKFVRVGFPAVHSIPAKRQ